LPHELNTLFRHALSWNSSGKPFLPGQKQEIQLKKKIVDVV